MLQDPYLHSYYFLHTFSTFSFLVSNIDADPILQYCFIRKFQDTFY
jgi:hypothetical protein